MKLAINLLLLALTLGCQSSQKRITQLYGGPEAITTLRTPDKVEAWRTTASFAVKEGTETKGRLADYVILNGPVPVADEVGAEMADILQRDIYEWNMAKSCKPTPGVAVRYSHGENQLLIFFCFERDILLIYFNGKSVGGEDFDRAHNVLADLARKIFPKDPALKKI